MAEVLHDQAALLAVLGTALLAGFALGALYFTLLWRSVRALSSSRTPWRGLAGGALVRAAVLGGTLAALLATGIDAVLIAPGAIGFLLARLAATALVRAPRVQAPGEG